MQLLWYAGGKSVPPLDVPEEPAFISGVSLTGASASLSAQVSTEVDTGIAAVSLAGKNAVLAATVAHEPEFFSGVTLLGKSPTLAATVSAPSTGPQRIGTATQVNASAGDGSTSVTIPVGAHAAVAFFSHWDGNVGSSLGSLSLGGNAFSITGQLAEGAVADNSGIGVALLLNLPAAGSQTLAWTWNGTHPPRSDGGEIIIIWVANIDEGNAIRDFGLEAENTTSNVAVTVDTFEADLVLAFCQSFGTGAVGLDGNVFINNAFLNDHTYDVSQVTPQAGTTTVNMTGESWASMAVIVLRASIGATSATVALQGKSPTLSASAVTVSNSPIRIGAPVQVNGSAGNGSTSITVPVGASSVVAFWSHWDGDVASTLSSLTLGGNSIPVLKQSADGALSGSSGIGVGISTNLPAAGSQTLVWTWSNGGSRSNGGEIVLVFVGGSHTQAPARASAIDFDVGGNAVQVGVESTVNDLILAFAQRYQPGGLTLDGTPLIDNASLNDHIYDLSQVTPQATLTPITATGVSWSSIAAVSLRPATEVVRQATATLSGGSASLAASAQQTVTSTRTATAALAGKTAALSASALFVAEPLYLAAVSLVGKSAVLSASGTFTAGTTEPIFKRFVFHINERFVTEGLSPASESEIANRLVRYVDDMNTVLAKSVRLQFLYDPETDCIFEPSIHPQSPVLPKDFWPPQFSNAQDVPTYHFGAWVSINFNEGSDGGTGYRTAVDEFAATAGLAFPGIWSDDDITNDTPLPGTTYGAQSDYPWQIFVILHELGHALQLGIPEWYAMDGLFDASGVSPTIDVQGSGGNSEYFVSRGDVYPDPMTSYGVGHTIEEYLNFGEYSPLNAAILEAYLFEQVPGLYLPIGDPNRNALFGPSSLIGHPARVAGSTVNVNIKVVDATTGDPIQGADVSMYGMDPAIFGFVQSLSTPMDDNETDASGLCTINWGGGFLTATADRARLFKVQAPGFEPNGAWATCYDVQDKIIVQNGYHVLTVGDWHLDDPLVIELMPLPVAPMFTTRTVKFMVDNRLISQGQSPASEATIRSRLAGMVSDCNTILAKTTNLQWTFNQSTDVEFVDAASIPTLFYVGSEDPPSNWHFYFTIELGTDVTSRASSVANGTSAGRVTASGWGALGFAFNAIWSDSERDSSTLLPSGFATKSQDYVAQLYFLLHEGMHNFAVAVGEYYSVNVIVDTTGVAPSLATGVSNPDWPFFNGIYWSDRDNVQLDPMDKVNDDWDRTEWLENVQFNELSSQFINFAIAGYHPTDDVYFIGYNRPTLLYEAQVTVEVRDSVTKRPISGATVGLYIQDQSTFTHVNLNSAAADTEVTNTNGRVTFTWGGTVGPGWAGNNLFRGFKVSAPGYQNNSAGLSAWDLSAYHYVNGGSENDWHYNGVVPILLTKTP